MACVARGGLRAAGELQGGGLQQRVWNAGARGTNEKFISEFLRGGAAVEGAGKTYQTIVGFSAHEALQEVRQMVWGDVRVA